MNKQLDNDIDISPLLDLQCGYLAKSGGEQLWTHSSTCANLALEIADRIPAFDDEENRIVQLACLTHDIGKITKENQAILRGEKLGPCKHKLKKEEYFDLVESSAVTAGFTHTEIGLAWEAAFIHHYIGESDIAEVTSSRTHTLSRLVRKCDRLVSMQEPDLVQIAEFMREYEFLFCHALVQFGRFPSAATDFVLQHVENSYRELGWQPILNWDNAILFISDNSEAVLPSKQPLVDELMTQFYTATLESRQFRPSFTGTLLSSVSAAHPELLLEAKQDEIFSGLDDVRRPLYFMKLAQEILACKNRLDGVAEKSVVLQMVRAANSTAGHKKARKLCMENFGVGKDEKVNADFFGKLFPLITAKEFLPIPELWDKWPDEPLEKCSGRVLFDILSQIAKLNPTEAAQRFDNEAKSLFGKLLAVEESDIDFAEYAANQLARYCSYKTAVKAEKALCERCGAPWPATITDNDNFPLKSQSVTQIKSQYGPQRAFCPLCIFDNLKLREQGRDHVWCKIRSRTPMRVDAEGLNSLVIRVVSGLLQRGRSFVTRNNLGELSQLPIPKVYLPIAEESKAECVHRSDTDMLFKLQALSKGQTIRDAAMMYMPAYQLLNLMGFNASIGSLEQNGLFGQSVSISQAQYHAAIATLITAEAITRQKIDKNNGYLNAHELLTHRPSVAIALTFNERDAGTGKKAPALFVDKLRVWLDAVKAAGDTINSKKGGISMDTLLNDAAFLAARMKTYCEDIYKGGLLSKHSASKPISQALNELLRNRSTDIAKQKFRDHLRADLGREKASHLPDFLSEVDSIIERFAQLKNESIPEFIKAKNALASAVYTFTRYSELIPEQKGDE